MCWWFKGISGEGVRRANIGGLKSKYVMAWSMLVDRRKPFSLHLILCMFRNRMLVLHINLREWTALDLIFVKSDGSGIPITLSPSIDRCL